MSVAPFDLDRALPPEDYDGCVCRVVANGPNDVELIDDGSCNAPWHHPYSKENKR